MKRFIQDKVALLFVPACLLLAAPAFGQSVECSDNDDCAEGQLCQKGMSVGGCTGTGGGTTDPAEVDPDAPNTDAPDAAADCTSEPQEAETGYCTTPPTPCEADDECDEYLSCVAAYDTGSCAVDSEGNMTCVDLDIAPAKYCSIAAVACATNDDCPREFECTESSACPAILCLEDDEECLDACEPSGEKYCSPKRIDCEESTDCPSDWSCVGNVVETCSGGGTSPSEGSDGAASPDSGSGEGSEAVAPEDATCTTEAAVGICQPDAWSGDVVYASDGSAQSGADDGSVTTPTSGPNDPSAESESVSSGGGCSVALGSQPVDFAWVLALLAALPFVRRRQPTA